MRALVGGGDEPESEGAMAGVCSVRAAFDGRAFDYPFLKVIRLAIGCEG